MSIGSEICNRICKALYQNEYRRFVAPCELERVQTDYLLELLHKNADTVYGEKYGFADIKSYKEFAETVPLTTYEDYEAYIEEIGKGKKGILTKEPVLLLELTSGSSGGKKFIPYTKSLKQEFQKGIKPWLYNIYDQVEGVCQGRSYWSITPVTAKKSYTEAGIPIGFEEDAEYFGGIEQGIMKQLFAVSSKVKFSSDMEAFYMQTSVELLQCKELTLISVWNPTFLTILCDFMREHVEEILQQVPECGSRKTSHHGKESEAVQVAEAIRTNQWEQVFPNLKIISCWADGSAADSVKRVREYFPNTYIQPKGLLATECFVSFPMVGEEGSRLSLYSHFFEFRSVENDRIYMVHQLKKGMYEVIVTTGGGLYRYCIGDMIEVLETYEAAPPRVRFLRRKGITCDLYGEKLTEEFVRKVCMKLGLQEGFCLLAPEGNRYCLYTQEVCVSEQALDEALCENYHYDYCRRLGQLQPVIIQLVTGNPGQDYLKRLTTEGMRLGDIKPAYLSGKSGWSEWFHLAEMKEINRERTDTDD